MIQRFEKNVEIRQAEQIFVNKPMLIVSTSSPYFSNEMLAAGI
jgi:hypothetical protein